jgi:hypothetical protein
VAPGVGGGGSLFSNGMKYDGRTRRLPTPVSTVGSIIVSCCSAKYNGRVGYRDDA